jgi:hypothetical protein
MVRCDCGASFHGPCIRLDEETAWSLLEYICDFCSSVPVLFREKDAVLPRLADISEIDTGVFTTAEQLRDAFLLDQLKEYCTLSGIAFTKRTSKKEALIKAILRKLWGPGSSVIVTGLYTTGQQLWETFHSFDLDQLKEYCTVYGIALSLHGCQKTKKMLIRDILDDLQKLPEPGENTASANSPTGAINGARAGGSVYARSEQSASAVGSGVRAGADLVGARVDVFWEGEGISFSGTVTRFHPNLSPEQGGEYRVEYDDGDVQFELFDSLKVRTNTAMQQPAIAAGDRRWRICAMGTLVTATVWELPLRIQQ